MMPTKGYATTSATSPLAPFQFERRDPGPKDVHINLLYCGVCHSDLHQVRNEWGGTNYPLVPGHEMVGRVKAIGSAVSRFKVGDIAGVGCFVDSCRECPSCRHGEEQFCPNVVFSYNSITKGDTKPTYGGYSSQVVVDENYTLKIAPNLPLERVAPLLCAGITTYSPLHHWKVKKGSKVGVVGLGGLGHMAIKIAVSMGADVTVFSTSASKKKDTERLGAQHFVLSNDTKTMATQVNHFDFILDAVSAKHDLNPFLQLLKTDGSMVLVGAPPDAVEINAFSLIMGRHRLAGSLIGGIRETQEMLDYCVKHNVLADVEVIPMADINKAYERMLKGDVRYRFVIDLKTI